ncbi:MAG: dienelactone hydrolase family protein [Chloroflexi bacterium]|nr:dienelactone hydrolase family protein [Chloroflexota bacterium]
MPDTQPEGYLARPASGAGAPVLVLHAWWGLNDTLKAFCDRLAQAGFLAFAADLFHGKVAQTIQEAGALSSAAEENYPQLRAAAAAAAGYLYELAGRPAGGVAAVGFSFGATYALDLPATHPDLVKAVVVFYGSWVESHGNSRAAYQGHFAEHDPYEPSESVDALEASLRKAGRPVEFFHYPGTGHWFFEPDRPDAYDAQAAGLAWERTLAFLQRTIAAWPTPKGGA